MNSLAGAITQSLQLFPVGQCHQFFEDLRQSLKPTFVIACCAPDILLFDPAHAQWVRFANLHDLGLQLAFFDGTPHDDRLAGQSTTKSPPSEDRKTGSYWYWERAVF
jgi:hypothetical protein